MIKKLKNKITTICNPIIKKYRIIKSRHCKIANIQPKIKNTNCTINRLLDSKCSMSRFGDGEFAIIFGNSINYQKWDKELAQRLKEILKSNIENHIVCISDVFGDMEERKESNKKFWTDHLNEWRYDYYKYIDMDKIYYNTSATRVYSVLQDTTVCKERFNNFKKLWNNKEIIIVEGSKTRMGVGNNFFNNAKKIERIIGPAENAFSKYKEILNFIKKQSKSKMIIISLGPAATVLAYDLCKEGFYALDLGHIDIEYEWYLRQDCSVKINGKYTNEINGGNKVYSINDKQYISQIIQVFN